MSQFVAHSHDMLVFTHRTTALIGHGHGQPSQLPHARGPRGPRRRGCGRIGVVRAHTRARRRQRPLAEAQVMRIEDQMSRNYGSDRPRLNPDGHHEVCMHCGR